MEVFLFHGDFILVLHLCIIFLRWKYIVVPKSLVLLWQPPSQKKRRWQWVSLLFGAQPGCAPAPRAQLRGRAGFGVDTGCAPTLCQSVRSGLCCLPFEETSRGTLRGCWGGWSSDRNGPWQTASLCSSVLSREQTKLFSQVDFLCLEVFWNIFMQTESKLCTCTKSEITNFSWSLI